MKGAVVLAFGGETLGIREKDHDLKIWVLPKEERVQKDNESTCQGEGR